MNRLKKADFTVKRKIYNIDLGARLNLKKIIQ